MNGIKLTKKQRIWVEDVLTNDESSSDKEMVEYFVENGIEREKAVKLVSLRDQYLNQI
jgi:hypothetical protein